MAGKIEPLPAPHPPVKDGIVVQGPLYVVEETNPQMILPKPESSLLSTFVRRCYSKELSHAPKNQRNESQAGPTYFLCAKCLIIRLGSSQAVQWSGLLTSTSQGIGLIPNHVTKIPHAVQWGKKKPKQNYIK